MKKISISIFSVLFALVVSSTNLTAGSIGLGVSGLAGRDVGAKGALCQWPCSTDQTFPGGGSPGGWDFGPEVPV